jgi:hypothetical protein
VPALRHGVRDAPLEGDHGLGLRRAHGRRRWARGDPNGRGGGGLAVLLHSEALGSKGCHKSYGLGSQS